MQLAFLARRRLIHRGLAATLNEWSEALASPSASAKPESRFHSR